jgi:putative cell wall-binding protein
MEKAKKHSRKKKTTSGKSRKWSASVMEHSDALDLEKGVFTSDNPENIAKSLEKSAEKSTRKKGTSYQSAMSMLNFYINRAGKNLPAKKKKVLTKAKDLLKELHEKDQAKN